jgi:hypothetical protein
MNTAESEDLKEEVCMHLEIGMGIGETELETMTRLVWVERRNNVKTPSFAFRSRLRA